MPFHLTRCDLVIKNIFFIYKDIILFFNIMHGFLYNSCMVFMVVCIDLKFKLYLMIL